ncbi:hypothetical protein B0T26DRAFT_396204 [Lasiosphaeria miniovina]|uniref:Uncharacterized protein n=1 Tax=Lasiosphaeria miniovina TaxID=1954250 RepID=A0AA40A4S8_9PEZI|nr:uncharacterized protein B0T26DRAFT_396204 [Lasiosphaeria miniovina]KAK0709156.1 hypothetical protein B0T26DRAFT_396204 [Lasiosphaeria miniovina]
MSPLSNQKPAAGAWSVLISLLFALQLQLPTRDRRRLKWVSPSLTKDGDGSIEFEPGHAAYLGSSLANTNLPAYGLCGAVRQFVCLIASPVAPLSLAKQNQASDCAGYRRFVIQSSSKQINSFVGRFIRCGHRSCHHARCPIIPYFHRSGITNGRNLGLSQGIRVEVPGRYCTSVGNEVYPPNIVLEATEVVVLLWANGSQRREWRLMRQLASAGGRGCVCLGLGTGHATQ